MTIMIVDNHEEMRGMIREVLASPGVEFAECEDGGMAVSQYSQVMPDWVLMDLSMEYVDGISAIEELKSMFPEAKIAVVTNYDGQELRAKSAEAGALAYVMKERMNDLRSLIYGKSS
jgi:two-component system response regulator DegU